jgi:nifR3 family TIM-barrel protein
MDFLNLPTPTVLAPMAGVTDYAYRCICAGMGASVTVTEMVSSRALIYQDKKSRSLLRKTDRGICGAQIFGNEPEMMAQAAVLALEHSGCDFIDINMGCPMPKIANNGDGSALMKDIPLAAAIVSAVKKAVSVPVTVKTRLGWDKGSIRVVAMAKALEEAGADAIAVHGRTKSMLYSGTADWDEIGKVVRAVSVPVIANGDICGPEEALRCRNHTGAALYMIGRAAFGDPWIFAQVNAALSGKPVPERPPFAERLAVAETQFSIMLEDKGEHIACLEARKQLAWYLRGVPHSGFYKEKISHLATAEEFAAVVKEMKRDLR